MRTDRDRPGTLTGDTAAGAFDSIEGAYEYLDLLVKVISEVRSEVDSELVRTTTMGHTRRKQAFDLVAYNLSKLDLHVTRSRRILNDLRTLRRLLLGERSSSTIQRPNAAAQ